MVLVIRVLGIDGFDYLQNRKPGKTVNSMGKTFFTLVWALFGVL